MHTCLALERACCAAGFQITANIFNYLHVQTYIWECILTYSEVRLS